MLQATTEHGEGLAPSDKTSRSCSISNTASTNNRKQEMIRQRLSAAEREIAFLQMQVHELKNAHLLLETLYTVNINVGATKNRRKE